MIRSRALDETPLPRRKQGPISDDGKPANPNLGLVNQNPLVACDDMMPQPSSILDNSINQFPRTGTIPGCEFSTAAGTAALNEAAQNSDDLSQLPELRARMRTYVDRVIRSSMPLEQSQVYMEAMAKAPDLVLTETDPLQFVRFCKYDLWAAAQRLCSYWTERKRLFGQQRAFLPLVLTGTGALTPDDVHTLYAGYPAILPDTTSGKKCVLMDRNNWVDSATDENKLRAWFYISRILGEDDACQIEGPVILCVAVTPRDRELDWPFVRRVTSLSSRVFPIRPCVHFLNIPSRRKHAIATAMSRTIVDIVQLCYRNYNPSLHIHIQTEPNQILNELLSLGLTKKGIPMLFGGEWKIDDWYHWCQERKEWELETYGSRLLKKPPNSTVSRSSLGTGASHDGSEWPSEESRDSKTSDVHWRGSSTSLTNDTDTDILENEEDWETRQERIKRDNVLRSRRERERRRIEFNNLKKESAHLRLENERLLLEQVRLIDLLSQAEQVVAQIMAFPHHVT